MSTFGILGSGFGLYGYLPAVIESGHSVKIPARYKAKVLSRFELLKYTPQISYVQESVILHECDDLVLALDPQSQYEFLVRSDLSSKNLWLEKPLAPSIAMHQELVDLISQKGYEFNLGYLFQYTDWWNFIINTANDRRNLHIQVDWELPKPQGWKSISAEGGGILAFYAIHFVPLLLQKEWVLGKTHYSQSRDKLDFELLHTNGPELRVKVSYGLDYSFRVSMSDEKVSNFEPFIGFTPFGQLPEKGKPDPRLPFLIRYIQEVSHPNNQTSSSLQLEQTAIDFRKSFL